MLDSVLVAFVPPMPPEQRFIVACIGALLGWLLVSRKAFLRTVLWLCLTAASASAIGFMLNRWDWFGQATFLLAVVGGLCSSRLMLRYRA
jgi:hypothetical protein